MTLWAGDYVVRQDEKSHRRSRWLREGAEGWCEPSASGQGLTRDSFLVLLPGLRLPWCRSQAMALKSNPSGSGPGRGTSDRVPPQDPGTPVSGKLSSFREMSAPKATSDTTQSTSAGQ